MKNAPAARRARSAARPNGNGKAAASHSKPDAYDDAHEGALVRFAAERAHDMADALHAQAKDGIDRAQRAIGDVRVETLWQQLQPALIGAVGFVRHYPMRAAMIVGLLGSAYWLTRVDERKPA